MKLWVLTAAIALLISLGDLQTASAVSCSEQGKSCKSWAASNLAGDQKAMKDAQAYCGGQVSVCINRCKNGEKWFIGIGGSNRYPIDTCN